MLQKIVEGSHKILDIGTGPKGSYFYPWVRPDAKIIGIDAFNQPEVDLPNFSFEKMDALDLAKVGGGWIGNYKKEWVEYFDLIVADHVFEHVAQPEVLAQGINKITAKDAYVHIAIPDPKNFTEKFYHLIHPEGGGHVSQIEKSRLIAMMEKEKFVLEKYQDIPDSWTWLTKLYDWQGRGIKYFSQIDLEYIAEVFRRELTGDKGYFYGGEYLFRKI